MLKGFWENLLETRVKLQNVLNVANQLPQPDSYEQIVDSLKPEMKKSAEDVLNESKKIYLFLFFKRKVLRFLLKLI